MDCSLPVPPSMRILQARIQAWVAMPSFRDLPDPGIGSPEKGSGHPGQWSRWHVDGRVEGWGHSTGRPALGVCGAFLSDGLDFPGDEISGLLPSLSKAVGGAPTVN